MLIGLLQSNRDHWLTFRRIIIGKWMYTAQVPINNALVLGNLTEYRHKWHIANTRFFVLHFCRRLCLSSSTLTSRNRPVKVPNSAKKRKITVKTLCACRRLNSDTVNANSAIALHRKLLFQFWGHRTPISLNRLLFGVVVPSSTPSFISTDLRIWHHWAKNPFFDPIFDFNVWWWCHLVTTRKIFRRVHNYKPSCLTWHQNVICAYNFTAILLPQIVLF